MKRCGWSSWAMEVAMAKWLSILGRVKQALRAATKVIITAPLKLPAKLVAGARYVALLIGLLDALESNGKPKPPDDEEGEADDRG